MKQPARSRTAGKQTVENPGAPQAGSGMPERLRASELDREAKLFLRMFCPLSGRPFGREHVKLARYSLRIFAMALGRQVPVASVERRTIEGPGGSIVLAIYTPIGAEGLRPGFVWCHGGAFVAGGLETADSICRGIARSANAVVVAVRYRLAPEHDLYAGRDDFLAALDWVAAHGQSIGIDTTRLALGGDSAGGNIVAAVAQDAQRRGGPKLVSQVLVYPSTDLSRDFPSKEENADGYFLTAAVIDSIRDLVQDTHDLNDPRLSPALSPDLRGLPPTLILTAGFDPIRDDGLRYAAQLRAAGVPVELLHYSGQFHGFLNFDSLIGAARDALKRIGASLARAYRGERADDCTVEISDQPTTSRIPLSKLPGEWVSAAFMISRSLRQFSQAAVRQTSPEGANAMAFLFRPFWMPVALLRRGANACLDTLIARQTWGQRDISKQPTQASP